MELMAFDIFMVSPFAYSPRVSPSRKKAQKSTLGALTAFSAAAAAWE